MKHSTFATLVFTSASAAVAGKEYPEMNALMDKYGYSAEPFEATSDTGYISTIFQVKGDYQGESKGSVIVMQGTFGDAHHWFYSPTEA